MSVQGRDIEVLAPSERARVTKIDEYGLLSGEDIPGLGALVEIAAQVARVPRASIDIITDTEQHHVAAVGFEGFVCSRDDSMCSLILGDPEPVVLADARHDARFAHNPFVTGEIAEVRFYGGHQLRTPEGIVIGTLCVFDEEVRQTTAEQRHSLAALAERVVDILELQLRSRQLAVTNLQLEQARSELERSNEHLSAFAGQVSHDLRTPLTSMSMSLQMIADHVEETPGLADDTDLAFLTKRAISGADRMTAMVHDLLGYAVVGGGREHESVDLAAVVDDILTDLSAVLTDAGVEVGDLPVVSGNPTQLRAVLQNFLSNAAKFRRPGEPARIRVAAARVDTGPRGGWRIAVSDAGPGIPAERREEMFGQLARLDTSVQGSGIGLATCRRVIEAHGGRTGLDASPWGGTTAWFELPD